MDEPEFSRAGDVLKELFEKILPSTTEGYGRLFSGWSQIVGEEMAFHAVPKDVVRGSLIIETDHPGWKQRLLMEKERILAVLTRRYPELDIRNLRIVLAREKRPSPLPSSAVAESAKTDETQTVVPATETIPEGPFRDMLERMKRHGDS